MKISYYFILSWGIMQLHMAAEVCFFILLKGGNQNYKWKLRVFSIFCIAIFWTVSLGLVSQHAYQEALTDKIPMAFPMIKGLLFRNQFLFSWESLPMIGACSTWCNLQISKLQQYGKALLCLISCVRLPSSLLFSMVNSPSSLSHSHDKWAVPYTP